MRKLIRGIDRISYVFSTTAGIMMILLIILILTEIIVRKLFNSTIYISNEYVAYFMVALSFFGMAHAMKDNEHIRLVLLHKLIKKGKARFFLNLYALLIGFATFVVITVITWNLFWDNVVTGSQSLQITRTYLAIPQFAMPLGSLLMTLQFAAEIMRLFIKWREGKLDDVEEESQTFGSLL